jgi:hypothetical protein
MEIIGTYPNSYDLSGKYYILVEGSLFYNQDYQEQQTGVCMVGNGRYIVICDTLEELLAYIEKNNLSLYDNFQI